MYFFHILGVNIKQDIITREINYMYARISCIAYLIHE